MNAMTLEGKAKLFRLSDQPLPGMRKKFNEKKIGRKELEEKKFSRKKFGTASQIDINVCVHAGRTIGGYGDHRRFDRPVAPRCSSGPGIGPPGVLLEQYETACHRCP